MQPQMNADERRLKTEALSAFICGFKGFFHRP